MPWNHYVARRIRISSCFSTMISGRWRVRMNLPDTLAAGNLPNQAMRSILNATLVDASGPAPTTPVSLFTMPLVPVSLPRLRFFHGDLYRGEALRKGRLRNLSGQAMPLGRRGAHSWVPEFFERHVAPSSGSMAPAFGDFCAPRFGSPSGRTA